MSRGYGRPFGTGPNQRMVDRTVMGECKSGGECLAIIEAFVHRVADAAPAPVFMRGFYELMGQRPAGRFQMIEIFAGKLGYFLSYLTGGRVGGHWFSEMNRDWIWEFFGQCRKYFAVIIAEYTSPCASDICGYDWAVGVFCNFFEAGSESVEQAVSGDYSFGEYAYE